MELANVLALEHRPGGNPHASQLPENPALLARSWRSRWHSGPDFCSGTDRFIRDRLDDRISSVADLEGRLSGARRVPGNAAVAAQARVNRRCSTHRAQPPRGSEAPCRSGGILSANKPVKLAVTSVARGEDAGFVGCGYGGHAGPRRDRVLFVSAETENSELHRVLGLPNEPGLTEMMMDGPSMSTVARRVPGVPRLKVITSGKPWGRSRSRADSTPSKIDDEAGRRLTGDRGGAALLDSADVLGSPNLPTAWCSAAGRTWHGSHPRARPFTSSRSSGSTSSAPCSPTPPPATAGVDGNGSPLGLVRPVEESRHLTPGHL